MGRLLKYKTDTEKRESQRRWSLEYYHRNKEKIDEGRKWKYWVEKFRQEGILKG